jgi:error-prone DNA polymerase
MSDWPCSIERETDHTLSLRLGLGYVRGLRERCVEAIVAARAEQPFISVDDLVIKVPLLNRKELALLANVGALNSLQDVAHRRDALWQVERAGKPEGALLMQQSHWLKEESADSPLLPMTPEERLVADYAVSSLTTGPHPMWFRRKELQRKGYLRAADLANRPDGSYVKAAGLAIVKQRPGTASGVVFLSVADETGVFNVFVAP